jgi:hypothetical protein
MYGTIPPLPQYTFMAWCSIKQQKHRDNFTSPLPLPYPFKYLLTPWCRILFEKLIVTQLIKKILLSYET